jgi:von Willebrand factor A domain-containing protein 7
MRILLSLIVPVFAAVATAVAAQDQQPRSRPGWPCVGKPDPSYFTVAEGSGGQVFLFDPSEVAESSVLMIGAMKHEETVFRAAGTLAEGVHEFSIPIDSTVESALFSISLQCLQVVEIVRPAGDELRENDPGVDYHQFQAGRIVTVPRPTPGAWTVRVAGKGMFFLVLQAKTDLTLDRVSFVEPGGRPGHEGLFPIKGSPKRGVAQHLEVEMSGPFQNPAFRFISSSAETVQDLSLQRQRGPGDNLEFLGEVTPRARQFRLAVSGVDARGFAFQRVHAPLFTVEAR